MIIISEQPLPTEQFNLYKSKGYKIARIYDPNLKQRIDRGEAIGFYLTTLNPNTISFIEKILWMNDHTKKPNHNISIRYQDHTSILSSLKDWKWYNYETHQNEYHPVLSIYTSLQIERKQKRESKKEQYIQHIMYQPSPLSEEETIDFVRTFATLYDLHPDYSNYTSVLICYHEIETYLELGIPYLDDTSQHSVEALRLMQSNCIDKDETPFYNFEFLEPDTNTYPTIEIHSVGNATLLDDMCYNIEVSEVL